MEGVRWGTDERRKWERKENKLRAVSEGEGGATREKEKRKTTKKIHGCSEGGHGEGWCDRIGY